MSTISLCVHI